MTPYQRIALRQLRDGWGVEGRSGRGGKHPFVEFVVDGRRHRLTVNNLGADPVAVANWTRQSLHAALGPPTRSVEGKIKRRMEDMMPTEARLPSGMACRVALYGNAKPLRLRFNLPGVLGLDAWAGVGAKFLGTDAWELWNDPKSTRRWAEGDLVGGMKVDVVDTTVVIGEPFGSSPAEVVEVDGRLLVTCPLATRIPVKTRAMIRAKEKADIITNKLLNDTFFGPSHRERMLAALREIAAIETETECRLAHENGIWEWRVPPVRLEG